MKDNTSINNSKDDNNGSILKNMPRKPLFPGFPNDDCERPSCHDVSSALKNAMKNLQNNNKETQKNHLETAAASPPSSSKIVECPPTKSEIGRGTWSLLHTMAAWYPDKPTKSEQNHMKSFFDALALFYPCPWCAHDFQQNLKETPVDSSSRETLCQWLCEQHNTVNSKLGKPIFKCDMKTLDERWRKNETPECQE